MGFALRRKRLGSGSAIQLIDAPASRKRHHPGPPGPEARLLVSEAPTSSWRSRPIRVLDATSRSAVHRELILQAREASGPRRRSLQPRRHRPDPVRSPPTAASLPAHQPEPRRRYVLSRVTARSAHVKSCRSPLCRRRRAAQPLRPSLHGSARVPTRPPEAKPLVPRVRRRSRPPASPGPPVGRTAAEEPAVGAPLWSRTERHPASGRRAPADAGVAHPLRAGPLPPAASSDDLPGRRCGPPSPSSAASRARLRPMSPHRRRCGLPSTSSRRQAEWRSPGAPRRRSDWPRSTPAVWSPGGVRRPRLSHALPGPRRTARRHRGPGARGLLPPGQAVPPGRPPRRGAVGPARQLERSSPAWRGLRGALQPPHSRELRAGTGPAGGDAGGIDRHRGPRAGNRGRRGGIERAARAWPRSGTGSHPALRVRHSLAEGPSSSRPGFSSPGVREEPRMVKQSEELLLAVLEEEPDNLDALLQLAGSTKDRASAAARSALFDGCSS